MKYTAATLRHLVHRLATLLLLLSASTLHAAEEHATTVVFFPDHPMTDTQWSSLFNRIQSEFQTYTTASETRPLADKETAPRLDLIRGDRIHSGLVVDSAISVYLHGNCTSRSALPSHLAPPALHPGALGWVELAHHQIAPFIHIDCALITRLLSSSSQGLAADFSDSAAIAIARVFLHEWRHVSTQDAHHTHTGIAKSSFTADDLFGHAQTLRPAHPDSSASMNTWHGK
jgi:hypothetical protein